MIYSFLDDDDQKFGFVSIQAVSYDIDMDEGPQTTELARVVNTTSDPVENMTRLSEAFRTVADQIAGQVEKMKEMRDQ